MQSRNKFRATRFVLLKISWLFIFFSRLRRAEKRILIIKIDAIGDYILFRNYLEVLKKSEKYKGYKIDLLGNVKWKDLALEYDKDFVSDFIFINEDELLVKPLKVFKLGIKLFKRRYQIVLQSTYSRTLLGNGISALASPRENISYLSDNEHNPRYKKKTDKFYTSLIKLPDTSYHELERNHFFFEAITGEIIPFQQPSLHVKKNKKEGILIFPGSSTYKKNWEKEKFLEIINRILQTTNHNVIIAGGPAEKSIACYLVGQSPYYDRITDKTGNTTLPDLISLVAGSKLVISNDTNTVHIAAATDVPAICILGGGHFGRFLPYPAHFKSKPISIFSHMPCFNCSWECKYHTLHHEPFPCISRVNTESVWNEVIKLV